MKGFIKIWATLILFTLFLYTPCSAQYQNLGTANQGEVKVNP